MDQVAERRARLVARQLTGAADAVQAARSVVALHATDPATVYLSVLARCPHLALAGVAQELYDARRLVRLMGMRRTLFVVPDELVPVVHTAAALGVAATMRRRLLVQLDGPTDPALPADRDGWLAGVEEQAVAAAERLGTASGAQLAKAAPLLQTALLPTTEKSYDVRRTVATQVLTLLGAQGRLVRSRPLGGWTSRQHTWEPASAWWPDGLPELDPAQARARLVEEYLRRFGPATEDDVVWWTGWAKGVTRKALATVVTVERAGGLVLADDDAPVPAQAPRAVLLPALDPTPMGWKQRDWFLPEDASVLYDAYGNVGPTVWWDGEVVGGWAVRPDGTVVTRLLADRGADAARAVDDAAQELAPRLEGAVVVPSFRTPLERELSRA